MISVIFILFPTIIYNNGLLKVWGKSMRIKYKPPISYVPSTAKWVVSPKGVYMTILTYGYVIMGK